MMEIKILFIVPYPLKKSPSQRFRFEQYFQLLRQCGFSFSVSSFLNSRNWQVFSKPGKPVGKLWAMMSGFVKRFLDLFHAPFYHFIFIHREATPIGPPVFEWILVYIFRKKIIYDFDDAIWLTDKKNESALERILKWRSKVKYICRWSFKVSCSNEYLCNYASAFNESVVYLPTTIDTTWHHNPAIHKIKNKDSEIIIGWTGSYSTLKYLKEIEMVLVEIRLQNPQVSFLIIGDLKPMLSIPLRFMKWCPETEIQDLLYIDIGIMPLPDDEWTKGKGGFKCLQYMALKIPVVASRVGVNSKIVDHNVNGFLAVNSEEWKKYLLILIKDKKLRERMGVSGRKKVEGSYSVVSNSPVFLSLFT